MEAEVTDLIEEAGEIVGVRASTPQGPLEVRADLVIGADGRHSTVRARSGLEIIDLGSPIDVLWFRLSKCAGDPAQSLGNVRNGKFMVMIDRGDYWQCGFVISKGAFDHCRRDAIEKFRADVADVAPFIGDRTDDLKTWDDMKLLSVAVDRLRRWYRPGLLCIGDSAHAISPVGGVGINLAIQDAVAAANILAPAFGRGAPDIDALKKVQQRREWPTRVTQRAQIFMHDHFLAAIFRMTGRAAPPWPLRLLRHFAWLRRIPARLIGLGVRPEHVKTPDITRAS
jgi:2-polyprenyl-6-methoxyphenol hydroxylase-like FAD-dependent oxidoreductase